MTGNDIVNELLAELPPKPTTIKVKGYLDDTELQILTSIGPMEHERRDELVVDLNEPDSLERAKAWLGRIIAEQVY